MKNLDFHLSNFIVASIVLLIILQMFNGKYGSNLTIPLLWILLNLFPQFLYINLVDKKLREVKLIIPYTICLLFILFSIPQIYDTLDKNASEVLLGSFIVTIPFQAFVLITDWIKTSKDKYKHETIDIEPEEIEDLRNLIANDKIDEALEKMQNIFQGKKVISRTIINYKRQLKKLEKENVINVITNDQFRVETNNLANNILKLIEDF